MRCFVQLNGGNRIDTAPIASGKAKEKAGLRTRNASRLSLVNGGNRIDTAPVASGKAKEKAGLRTQIASRLSLVSRQNSRECPKSRCGRNGNPLPDAKFIIKTETGCALSSNSSKRSRFLLQEKRNAVSARPKTFPAPKTKERKDPPSQKLSATYQKRGSGNQLAGAETGRKRPWGVSRSCCAMDRESSGAPGSAVRSTETPFWSTRAVTG